jgi:protein-tyrosine phosphatase
LFQVNKGSLLGRFGHAAQETAIELVERGFATVVASDAHSARMRTPWMAEVREMLTETVSPRCARVLLEENPRKILKNEDVLPVQPEWFE